MPDFNQVLTPGDIAGGFVNTVVEIPEGSTLKVEWDREHKAFKLDRVEPSIFTKPVNYGFIPGTLDEDGDELDTLIYCDSPLPQGIWLEAKVLGVMKFMDDGEVDDKIVVRVADDRQLGERVNSIADLGERWRQQVEHHFMHYKDLKKPGSTQVNGWYEAEEAINVINECIKRYQDQQ